MRANHLMQKIGPLGSTVTTVPAGSDLIHNGYAWIRPGRVW